MKTIALLGQSLNQQMTTVISNPPISHPDTALWNGATWGAVTGNGGIEFCNKMQSILNEPIRLYQGAVGGSSLCAVSVNTTGYWLDTTPGAPLPAFYAKVAAGGSVPDLIVWNQGQQDYYYTNYNQYLVGMTTLYNGILAHFGKTYSELPIVVMIANKANYGANSAYIRQAQMDFVAGTPGAYIGSAHYDLPRPDGAHLSASGYETLARRTAVAALTALGVQGYKYRGAKILSGQRNGNRILLTVDLQGATALWPNNPWNSLTGFTVWNSNYSTQIPITSAYIVSPSWILLNLASNPGANCHVTYQWGNDADESNTPSSDSNPLGDPLGLPMQPTAANINIP